MAIPKEAWNDNEPMAESPEARFVYAIMLQFLLDCNTLGKRKLNRSRRKRPWSDWEEAYAAEMEFLASPKFHWYATLMDIDPIKMAEHIIKVANGEIQHTNLYVGFKTTNAAKNREHGKKTNPAQETLDGDSPPEYVRGGPGASGSILLRGQTDSDLLGFEETLLDGDASGEWWDDGPED